MQHNASTKNLAIIASVAPFKGPLSDGSNHLLVSDSWTDCHAPQSESYPLLSQSGGHRALSRGPKLASLTSSSGYRNRGGNTQHSRNWVDREPLPLDEESSLSLGLWSATLLTGFGAFTNSWFYVIGGTAVLAYVAWCYFTLISISSRFRMGSHESCRQSGGRSWSAVTFNVTISSNITVKGLIGAACRIHRLHWECNSKEVLLAPDVNETLCYTARSSQA